MKISIKTLKGDMFQVDVEPTFTVLQLKERISVDKTDFEVDRQKLIHAGKVLKDTATVEELAISETDFIVCMVTAKPKAPSAALSTPLTAPVTQSLPPAPAPSAAPSYDNPDAIASLVAMGFPENECRAAFQAAQGNANVAVEFLMNGIPEAAAQHAPTPAAGGSSSAVLLAEFRRHPNFSQLQRLVQDNPNELNRVLGVIGSQNPALLAAIHENHETFIAMMNEPISNTPSPAMAPNPAAATGAGGMGGMAGMNGAQMMQMMQSLPPAQRNMMAQSMGMTPDQLNSIMQMMASMPPEQLQQMMQGMGGMGGGPAAAAAGGAGLPTGAHVVRLTEEEMASVNRLMELGFSQQQAAQAFLACDRDEALAANFLFDGGDDMVDDGSDGGHDDHSSYM